MKAKMIILLFLAGSGSWAMAQEAPGDIVDVASGAGIFQTLLTAVGVAGLEDTLRSEGPFTVFAPTDDAFAAIPADTLNALLNDVDALTNVLLYHVVAGAAVPASEVVGLTEVTTANGLVLPIDASNGVRVGNANVLQTDVIASNGIIHVIDSVLLPPAAELDIVDTAVAAGRFSTLVAAVEAAGLVDALRGDGPFTVFAPNDEAFAKLPAGTVEALLADPDALAQILLYHVVSGELTASDVLSRNQVETLNGARAAISSDASGAFIDNARILTTDIFTSNGVIHEIDSVIIPAELMGLTYEVTITNATKNQMFSPPLIVSHSSAISLFQLGSAPSAGIAALAEEGNAETLVDAIFPSSERFDIATLSAPLLPGQSVTVEVKASGSKELISVAAKLANTNDTFMSATLEVPRFLFKKGAASSTTVHEYALAYDAGSEFNSELCVDVPGCGGTGGTPNAEAEGFVHIANGVQGVGDLEAAQYDWRGPVALITVRRK